MRRESIDDIIFNEDRRFDRLVEQYQSNVFYGPDIASGSVHADGSVCWQWWLYWQCEYKLLRTIAAIVLATVGID